MKIIYILILLTTSLYSQNSKEIYKEYHDNGQIKILGELIQINGLSGKSKVGDWKVFDEDKNLNKIITYSIFGARPIQIKTFENNVLTSHIIYDISRYKKFEFDILKKIHTLYDESGNITAKIEVPLNDEKLKGIKEVIENSSKQAAEYFRDVFESVILSDYQFIVKQYNKNGKYIGFQNMKTGEVEIYYDEFKGKLKQKGNQKNGECIWYHLNGKIKEIGKYKDNYQTGLWKEYDEDGKLIKKERY